MKEKQYAWSDSEDMEYVSYILDSIEECFADAIGTRLSPGDDIWIGEVKEAEIDYSFDAYEFVYNLYWNNDLDDDSVSGKEINMLRCRVEKVIGDWIAEFDVGKNKFNVVNIKQYVIPEAVSGER